METVVQDSNRSNFKQTCSLNEVIKAGFKIIDLGEVDPSGEKARLFVESEGIMLDHNNRGAMLWPVCPTTDEPEAARSNTALSFPLHTDCAFEDPSPRFVAMYVVREDMLGGGISQFLDLRPVLTLLSEKSREVLENSLLCWKVPKEFQKDGSYIAAPLITKDGGIRYRRDIIVEELLSREQAAALSEIDDLIQKSGNIHTLKATSGSVIVVDNWYVLHGRTEILDYNRHLIRIRFNPKSN